MIWRAVHSWCGGGGGRSRLVDGYFYVLFFLACEYYVAYRTPVIFGVLYLAKEGLFLPLSRQVTVLRTGTVLLLLPEIEYKSGRIGSDRIESGTKEESRLRIGGRGGGGGGLKARSAGTTGT